MKRFARTSKNVASKAGKALSKSKSSTVKSIAGSALSQRKRK